MAEGVKIPRRAIIAGGLASLIPDSFSPFIGAKNTRNRDGLKDFSFIQDWDSIAISPDQKVSITGVVHTTGTFLNNIGIFDSKIKSAAAVCLEGPSNGIDPGIKKLLALTKGKVKNVDDVLNIAKKASEVWDGGQVFFFGLMLLATLHNKKLAVIEDTYSFPDRVMQLFGAAWFANFLFRIVPQKKWHAIPAVDFISDVKSILEVAARELSPSHPDYNTPDGWIRCAWDVTDWRDTRVAQGIHAYAKAGGWKGNLAVFRGAAHGTSLQIYLKDPSQAAIKAASYPHLNALLGKDLLGGPAKIQEIA